MKIKFHTTLILLALLNQFVIAKSKKEYYWINSIASPTAEGVCLQIQSGDSIITGAWEDHCYAIQNFEYRPGYIYKVKVKVSDRKGVTQTKLKRVISKEIDRSLRLHDMWVVTHINGQALSEMASDIKAPTCEININKLYIAGKDGCNNYNGNITEVSEDKISITNPVSTRMRCAHTDVSHIFYTALTSTENYTIADNKLHLFDKDGHELLTLKKID